MEHITTVLDTYIKIDKPNYAIQIKGEWGCGKTFKIKKYFDDKKDDDYKMIYVSLYGINDVEQIDGMVYAKLNPFLSSKDGMKTITKSLIRLGATAAGFGFLKEIISELLSGSSQKPQIPSEVSTKDKKIVLIFDDLERTNANINDVLGYINYYLEHYHCHTIIIANEDKLPNENYKEIKEKLIGKNIEITPNFNDAFKMFLEKSPIQEVVENQKTIIKDIFERSTFKNLRTLRQALEDFAALHKKLETAVKQKEKLIRHLIIVFFALFFEIKKGKTAVQILEDEHKLVRSNNRLPYPDRPLYNKYTYRELRDEILFDNNTWVEILDKYIHNEAIINEQLKKSSYFYTENTPAWKRLGLHVYLSTEEFEKFLKQVKNQVKRGELESFEAVFSTSMTFRQLLNLKILRWNEKTIDKYLKKNLNCLAKKGVQFEADTIRILRMQYMDSSETVRLIEYTESLTTAKQKKDANFILENIENKIMSDVSQVQEIFIHYRLSTKAILKYIGIIKFTNKFIRLSSYNKLVIADMFKRHCDDLMQLDERRKGDPLWKTWLSNIDAEIDWLIKVKEKLEKKRYKPIEKYYINESIKSFNSIVEKWKKKKDEY